MKKLEFKHLAIVLTIVAVLFIGISLWATRSGLNSNTDQRAFKDLSDSTQTQTSLLDDAIKQQYASLESLAAYLTVQDDPRAAFLAATEQTNAIVVANEFSVLAYADLDGTAYSNEGASLGSVSDRGFFKDAVTGKGRLSIEYAETSELTPEPRILLGKPVLKNNVLVGMVFASKELTVFKEAIVSSAFNGSMRTIVTDGSGSIIMIDSNHVGHFKTDNLLDEYPADALYKNSSQDSVLETMQASQAGQFCTDTEYVSYMPLGISDWFIFGTVQKSEAATSYADNINNYMKSMLIVASLFAVFLILVLIATSSFSKTINKEHELIRQQAQHFDTALTELKSAVFSYDLATQKIHLSDNFEHLFGYSLPEDWAHHLNEKSAEYPEFDFEALIQAKNTVELSGKTTQAIVQAHNKDQELRWLRITMAPVYKNKDQISSISGLIIDITDRYNEHESMLLEQKHLTLAINNLASLVVSCNLTQNKYTVINTNNATIPVDLDGSSYNEMIFDGASTLYEEDAQIFIETFSRESVLASFKRGEKKVELEYRKADADAKLRWFRTVLLFVNNSIDDDVYAVSLTRDVTNGKEYELLLQKTFDSTIENMPSFVAKWLYKDGDVFLVYANKKYLEFLGTTEEAAFGKSIFSGIRADGSKEHSEEERDILKKLYACEKQKKPISSVTRGWKMNGEQYWLKVQASYFEEQDGYSVYYGTVTDITEQIKAQHKLSQTVAELEGAYAQVASVNAYRDLMDLSRFGGVLVRTLWKSGIHQFLYVSPGVLNICGYTEEEFKASITDGHYDILHQDDLARITEANQTLVETGDTYTLDFRIRHKNGHYLWIIEHALVAVMPSGQKVVASLIVDVSAQKKLEERLRVSQEEYKIAASLSSYAVLSYDVASRSYEVIANNDESHDFARTKTDVPDYAISIGAVAPESVELVRDIFDAIDKGEQRDKCIIALCSVTGTKYWMELSYTIIFDDDDKPLTAILAFDDITAKMQAEALFNISSTFLNYSKNATKLIVINLTRKTIRYETEGAHGLLSKMAETRSAEDAVKFFISRMVVPEDEDACRKFFSAERFLESYQNGILEESFEYRGFTADNIPHWHNAQTRLLESAYTHDIILYVVVSDIEEQKQTELELMRRAETDSMTGFLNRESFEAIIQAYCEDPENLYSGLFDAIIMIDIDNFKTINDTCGHIVGDEALQEVARSIKESLRDDDIVSRFGGDEFIALLPHMPSIEMIEQRCAKVCSALNFKLTEDLYVSGSIGIAVFPEDGKDFSTLLKKADTAMYQAKKAGGNCCARYADNGTHHIVLPESSMSNTNTISKGVFARTFGYFDLFVDGTPLHFTNAKEKELLALLIDRYGGTLTADEAISYLWEDEPAGDKQNSKYRKLAMNLKNTLQAAGIEDILIVKRGVRSIDVSKLNCDYYQFLKGNPEFKALYHGVYMSNYSWSENTIAALDNMV